MASKEFSYSSNLLYVSSKMLISQLCDESAYAIITKYLKVCELLVDSSPFQRRITNSNFHFCATTAVAGFGWQLAIKSLTNIIDS